MQLDLSALPEDVRALIAAQAGTIAQQQEELEAGRLRIAHLQAQIAKLRRIQFGRSSERLDTAVVQLELALEELEEQAAANPETAASKAPVAAGEQLKPARRPLPDHLPREVVTPPNPVPAADAAVGSAAWART